MIEPVEEAGAIDTLRAPFPWFGGKSRVAPIVWERFGNVGNYCEPFAGSLATLLGRPHTPRVETVNDLDCYLANFWRALQHDPEAVAYRADTPVNEAELHARHRWLVQVARTQAERAMTDPDFYDAKIAGWWVYGQCLWIGSGWCQTNPSPRNPTGGVNQRRRPHLTSNQGARSAATRSGESPSEQRKRPVLRDDTDTRGGVTQKRFTSTGNGQGAGVHRRWQGGGESGGGSGVHAVGLARQFDKSAQGHGINAKCFDLKTGGLYAYLHQLAARLRRVRVCCGDWSRVLTPSVTTYIGETAVFLDPPYKHDLRERCYAEDHDISADVRAWALANGDNPEFRIALCGYADEHGDQMPDTWECVAWKAHGGYSRTERGKANRDQERIWFSPGCLRPSDGLFSSMDVA